MSEQPFITFVIPVRDDAARLDGCLASIASSERPLPYEVVVIDNGSTDLSADVARRRGATVLSLPSAKVSAARNAGAKHASAPLLGFVDADHLLGPQWLDAAADVFRNESITAAGAPCSSPSDANWVQRSYGGLRPVVRGQIPTSWLGSGNLIVRRAAFFGVGGFDESLESCEDVDLCNRLVAHGAVLVADERFKNIHLGDPRSLRALFFGELWRGRDNMKVTLRGPMSLSALPSLVIPVVGLCCAAVIVAMPWAGLPAGLAALLIFVGLSTLRATRMSIRQPSGGARQFLENGLVALVYDAARAGALVARATHRTRRELAGERSVA